MSKIAGVQKCVGEYQGFPYSIYRITVLDKYSEKREDCCGEHAKMYKCKTALLDGWMAQNKVASLQNLLGMNLNFFFDEWGNVNQIQSG